MPVHISTGSFHLRVFSDRLLKMELPVCGFRLLFQLRYLLEGLIRAALLMVLVVPGGRFGDNLCSVGSFNT